MKTSFRIFLYGIVKKNHNQPNNALILPMIGYKAFFVLFELDR